MLIEDICRSRQESTSTLLTLLSIGDESNILSSALIRRNPMFLSVVFGGAFAFEMYVLYLWLERDQWLIVIPSRTFDRGFDSIWDGMNRGV